MHDHVVMTASDDCSLESVTSKANWVGSRISKVRPWRQQLLERFEKKAGLGLFSESSPGRDERQDFACLHGLRACSSAASHTIWKCSTVDEALVLDGRS